MMATRTVQACSRAFLFIHSAKVRGFLQCLMNFFCPFVCNFTEMIIFELRSKVFTLEKVQISFVFYSLNRTFAKNYPYEDH